jgi:hypothetical protein
MWVRKSERDLRVDRVKDRFSPLPSLGFALLAGGCAFLAGVSGWRSRYGTGYHPAGPPGIATERAVMFAVLMFVIFYIVQMLFPRWYRHRNLSAYICDACGTVQAGETDACVCGGRLEPLRNYVWRPDAIERT